MTRITVNPSVEYAAFSKACTDDPRNVVLLVFGNDPAVDAVYRKATTDMKWEDWEHVFIAKDPSVLADPARWTEGRDNGWSVYRAGTDTRSGGPIDDMLRSRRRPSSTKIRSEVKSTAGGESD